MIVNKTFPVERTAPFTDEDARDLEILSAISVGLTDPEICLACCVTGGQVTAMREVWEAGDADAL